MSKVHRVSSLDSAVCPADLRDRRLPFPVKSTKQPDQGREQAASCPYDKSTRAFACRAHNNSCDGGAADSSPQ